MAYVAIAIIPQCVSKAKSVFCYEGKFRGLFLVDKNIKCLENIKRFLPPPPPSIPFLWAEYKLRYEEHKYSENRWEGKIILHNV